MSPGRGPAAAIRPTVRFCAARCRLRAGDRDRNNIRSKRARSTRQRRSERFFWRKSPTCRTAPDTCGSKGARRKQLRSGRASLISRKAATLKKLQPPFAVTRRLEAGCRAKSTSAWLPSESGAPHRSAARTLVKNWPARTARRGDDKNREQLRRGRHIMASVIACCRPDCGCAPDKILAHRIQRLDFMHMRRVDLACRPLALQLRVHVPRPFASRVPGVPLASQDGALFLLWFDANPAAAMRVTDRCTAMMVFTSAAKCVSTSQYKRRFFPASSSDACRKVLRRMANGRYLVRRQEHRMAEALFTLGGNGKRVLEERGMENIAVVRQLPKQIEHVLGINDLRVAAELTDGLNYFYAAWELPGFGWRQEVIPDAVFSLEKKTWAVEFDRGQEGLQFFLRTKVPAYERGFAGLALAGVLVVAEHRPRMESLARAVGTRSRRFLFTSVDAVRRSNLSARVFWRPPEEERVTLL
ncbi:MAG: hypothetical protein C5B51_14835 [Terriglobia bacterium]|nr:MAG: hypothetical protein C5B51_14835 [Terriglobia bacterium]